jgi:hypothetical protein
MERIHLLRIWFLDCFEQIIQVLALIIAMILPFLLDFQAVVELKQPKMDIQELVIYYALRHGRICIAIVLAFLMIALFHKINGNKVLNKGNRYHHRTMIGYWICSYILGYGKCSLIRVPIADQFKLILSDMFSEYNYGKYDKINETESISVRRYGNPLYSSLLQQNTTANVSNIKFKDVNVYIAISDTYPITDEMLPDICNENNTIIIQREKNKDDLTRYESKELTKTLLNILKQIDNKVSVHIFPTTNPVNTYNIANDVFKTGGRDNIEHLYIYPQPEGYNKEWVFSNKEIKIF